MTWFPTFGLLDVLYWNMSDNILNFIKRSMENWNTEITSCRQFLAWVNIKIGVFHQPVTIAASDLYDDLHTDTIESSIGVHLQKWRKLKSSSIYK